LWSPRPRNIVAALLVVVLVAGLIVAVTVVLPWHSRAALHCADGVVRAGPRNECVGATDGSYIFARHLNDVFGKIRTENNRVLGLGRKYVTVGYLLPIPSMRVEGDKSDAQRHELEGAYLAQRRINLENSEPLIRMVIVNSGQDAEQWQVAVDSILAMAHSADHPLVAVAGLGHSVAGTGRAIAALAAHNIPMVGSVITADRFIGRDGKPVKGSLARVTPTNSNEAKAASAFLRGRAERAMLIQDTNPADLYSLTLGEAFQRAFPDGKHKLVGPIERYSSAQPGVEGTMRQMLPNICQLRPQVIYFAGRTKELISLIRALPARACPDLPIDIMTGDDASDLIIAVKDELSTGQQELSEGLQSKVTLRFTSLAHPLAWNDGSNAFSTDAVRYFNKPGAGHFPTVFPSESLDDGQAIVGYDAMLVTARAIQATTVSQSDLANAQLTIQPGAVIQAFNRLHCATPVAGASGWIFLENGVPADKAMPILQIEQDGTVKFVQLTSPSGRPPAPPDCPRGSP
jgi:hypothetical protein